MTEPVLARLQIPPRTATISNDMPPNPLRRDQVIQSYLDLFREPAYLEIGVAEGQTFHAINAAKKVAVDPKFGFTVPESTPGAEYHNSTSDAYFASLP